MNERNILRKLRRTSAFDHANGAAEPAAQIVSQKNGNGLFRLGQGMYQPPFKAQIQLSVNTFYFTVVTATGVYTPIAAAALVAALKTKLAAFLFANSDWAAGYATLQENFPVTGGWVYGSPFVYGRDYPRVNFGGAYVPLDPNATALLQKGDVVIPFTAITAGPVNTAALVVIRSNDGKYAQLLDASNSNLFKVNMIRYNVADATAAQLAQYANAINAVNQTMFGKLTKDTTNPNAFKNPEQQQANIIDVLMVAEINKEKGLATYVNYDVVNFQWNIFIESVVRV